jgi:SAM-dependent methyltransferase
MMQLPADERIQRASTFDEIAELYDQGRREPPDWLYDTLFASSQLDPAQARILEIGCGTGKSTLPLARRGCRVVALEMGANLARVAQQNLSAFQHVEVVNARFEDWTPTEAFDLAFAIASFHWLDPAVRYQRAADLLKPCGTLAVALSEHVYPPGYDPFFAQVQECYQEVGVGRLAWPPPPPEALPDSRVEIEQTGLFEDVRVVRRIWTEEFTADEHVALMQTASDHRLLEPAKRERLFTQMRRLIAARPAGRILKHNLMLLHIARKRAD